MMTCPCQSQQPYSACCEPYHLGLTTPKQAVDLMRSRYSAYVLGLADYLCQTWHSSTRPSDLTAAELEHTRWNGLNIVKTSQKATTATVAFEAFFKGEDGQTHALKETSRFVFESDRWFYLDGDCVIE